MSFSVEPVKRKSLSGQIADQLEQAIYSGVFGADQRLPTEEELAQRYQVSRPTIREALKRLAARNLIRSKRGPGGGTFVQLPDLNELGQHLASVSSLLFSMRAISLGEVMEARFELESLCCRLAVQHASESDLNQLREALEIQQDVSLSDEAFCAADVRFHRALAEASGNGIIALQMYSLVEALQPATNLIVNKIRERNIILDQHQKLLSALCSRNESAAIELIREQVSYLTARYEEALG